MKLAQEIRAGNVIMQGKDPGHDLTRFRFLRFQDGSPIRLGPDL